MHNFIAGLMGLFMGLSSFFHGGHGLHAHTNQTQTNQQASGTASPSGMIQRGFGRGRGMNLPVGQRPFFGTVTAVNGSTLTVQMVLPGRPAFNNPSMTPSITPGATQTITVTLDSNTQYTGGSQSDITINSKIAGVGKVNSDGSITATQIRVNATMPGPSGFHGRDHGRPDDNRNDK